MSYDPNKLTKLQSLKELAARVSKDFATKKALSDGLGGKADKATTLAGYGITDAFTKEEINGKLSSTYKPGGSVAFADLPVADAEHLGMVYNVTDAFTTTDAFIEGAGKKHPAGTNVVVVVVGEDYKLDVLAGFVDLSAYAKAADVVAKEEGKRLMTDAEGTKLGGVAEGATKTEAGTTPGTLKINGVEVVVVSIATDAEVTEMLNEVFGAPVAE